MERLGLPVEFVGGRRVTTTAVLAVVRTSFETVNHALCCAIGPLAVPLVGDEIGLRAERVPALGLVGDPLPSSPAGDRGRARRRAGSPWSCRSPRAR